MHSRRSIVAMAIDRPDADKKFDDYAPKVAFFFPGQGAQTVGTFSPSATLCAPGASACTVGA